MICYKQVVIRERFIKMKVINKLFRQEQGQIIVIVAIAMFALIAMAALILDGGGIMVNRRAAQNAADAGALAGAEVMCRLGYYDEGLVDAAVQKYTVVDNNASSYTKNFPAPNASEYEGLKVGALQVTAVVSSDSFFARIFGQDTLTASATATAGCMNANPGIVIPVAWACLPPEPDSDSVECDIKHLTYQQITTEFNTLGMSFPLPDKPDPSSADAEELSNALYWEESSQYGEFPALDEDGKFAKNEAGEYINEDGEVINFKYADQITILMDSEFVCGDPEEVPSEINCDWFDDGTQRNQLYTGANRGWLNLEGSSSGESNVIDWIENGLEVSLQDHMWLNGVPGDRPGTYASLETRVGEVVWVPVFNVICDANPDDKPICYQAAHFESYYTEEELEDVVPYPCIEYQDDGYTCEVPLSIIREGGTSQYYYHIISFVPFMITCTEGSVEEYNFDCPGRIAAEMINPNRPGELQWSSVKTLEGYFIDPGSLPAGDAVHTGADLGDDYRAVLLD